MQSIFYCVITLGGISAPYTSGNNKQSPSSTVTRSPATLKRFTHRFRKIYIVASIPPLLLLIRPFSPSSPQGLKSRPLPVFCSPSITHNWNMTAARVKNCQDWSGFRTKIRDMYKLYFIFVGVYNPLSKTSGVLCSCIRNELLFSLD